MFKILLNFSMGVMLIFALAGCQTSYTSQGPLTTSSGLADFYSKFKDDPEAGYMAVTADGQFRNYSYCPYQRCGGNS